MKFGPVLLSVVALCACKETSVDVPAAPEDSCGAASYQALVGQGRAAVAEAGLVAGPDVRILGPESVVTMDFRGDRLNILLDDSGLVERVSCG
ncbi:I78 family peptidase inhibitor [Pseudooceanicola sp. C21-150M6]|uniref:I78 family peptidase inhibitor n=1 Tax=Pseudooceanicola sp. C21-150M6 TaxID=3434355 RepID=UPI003D7FF1E9